MQVQSSNFKLEEKPVAIAPEKAIQNWLIAQLSELLSRSADTFDISESLTRYGLDSIDAVTLVGDLEEYLDTDLPSTLFWDYPTIEKSAAYLADNFDTTEIVNNITAEPTAKKSASEDELPKTESDKGWGNLFGRLKG